MQFAKKTLDPKRIGKLLSMLTIVHGFLKKSNELLAKMAAAYTSCRLLRAPRGAQEEPEPFSPTQIGFGSLHRRFAICGSIQIPVA
jgi:hypothetical protein